MSKFFDIPLSDVITLQNDKKAQLKTSDYRSSGVLPIVDQSSKFVCGYTDDISKKYSKPLPVIVFGDHTLHTKYIDFDFAVGADGTQVIKTLDPNHQHRYLYYVISREIRMMGSEGYKRHLKILKERIVPFTNSVSEQKKIASILTSVDKVIEGTQKQIDKLQDLKKATMNELLTRGIGHTEFKDSELGRIPKSWEVLKLGSVGRCLGGFAFKSQDASSEGTRWMKIANVGVGVVKWDDESFLPKSFLETYSNFVLRQGDIVCAMTRPILNGKLKVATISESDAGALLNQRVCKVIPSKRISSGFLFHLLQSDIIVNQIDIEIAGSDPPNVSGDQIESVWIALPNIEEQRTCSQVISSIQSQIDNLLRKLIQTQSLKKSLMQDLLTGKVRVTVN